MIPRGKRKKRVGKERKKEKGRRERRKKIPFCFPFFLTSIVLFLQFRYFNPSARFYLEYRTVPSIPVSSLPTVPSIAIGVLVCFSTVPSRYLFILRNLLLGIR